MVVGTLANEHLQFLVLLVKRLEEVPNLLLGHCLRQVIFTLEDDILRDIGIEVVQRLHPYAIQHRADIIFRVREIRERGHTTSRCVPCKPPRPSGRQPVKGRSSLP